MSIMPESMQAEDIYSQLAMVNGLSDQQLQALQQNPTLGWMAGIVANERAQARVPTPPAPQGTVIGSKLAQLQQGGIPAGMMNQQALQANPMAAGIAGAPENVPGAATGGIVALAGGGSVRGFANGSSSYAMDGQLDWDRTDPRFLTEPRDYGDLDWRQLDPTLSDETLIQALERNKRGPREEAMLKGKMAASRSPYKEEEWERAAEKVPSIERQGSAYELANAASIEATNKISEAVGLPTTKIPEGYGVRALSPKQWINAGLGSDKTKDPETGATVTPKAPPPKAAAEGVKAVKTAAPKSDTPPSSSGPTGIPAAGRNDLYRTVNDPTVSSDQSISAISEALGVPYAMSAELKGKMEKAQAEAEQGRWVRAGLSALGTALSAPTEHAGKAIGMGLVAGVNQFQQETDPEKIRNLMLQGEAAEDEATAQRRHEAGLEYLKQRAARAGKTEEHQFQLLKQNMSDRAKILAAEIKAANAATTPQELEDKLVEKLVGIYGTTLTPSEIRAAARQLAQAGGGAPVTGMNTLGTMTRSGQIIPTAG